MKAKVSNKSFTPVSITLTFESQKELDVYASLFNVAPISDVIEEYGVEPVNFTLLSKAGGHAGLATEMFNKLMNHPAAKNLR